MRKAASAPGSAPAIRVLVVGDDPLLRTGIACVLGKLDDVTVVGEADEGGVAAAAADLEVDAIIHAELPSQHPSERGSKIRTIMLGDTGDPVDVESAFAAGADAFLVKARAAEHLQAALRTVVRGGQFLDPEVGANVAASLVKEHPRMRATLSHRERGVLALLREGRANDEIAAELGISPRTVEGHRTRLGRKLGLRSRAELVEYALVHHLASENGGDESDAA